MALYKIKKNNNNKKQQGNFNINTNIIRKIIAFGRVHTSQHQTHFFLERVQFYKVN